MCPKWDSNPHNFAFETNTYTSSIIWAFNFLVFPAGFEPALYYSLSACKADTLDQTELRELMLRVSDLNRCPQLMRLFGEPTSINTQYVNTAKNNHRAVLKGFEPLFLWGDNPNPACQSST